MAPPYRSTPVGDKLAVSEDIRAAPSEIDGAADKLPALLAMNVQLLKTLINPAPD